MTEVADVAVLTSSLAKRDVRAVVCEGGGSSLNTALLLSAIVDARSIAHRVALMAYCR